MANIEQRIENLKRFIEIDKATINEMVDQGFDEEVIETERETLKSNEEELERLIRQRLYLGDMKTYQGERL